MLRLSALPARAAWLIGIATVIATGVSVASTIDPATSNPADGQIPETLATSDTQVLDTVEVLAEGVQFGPGMWRVHRDGRSLWILGTQSPLPRRMQWHAEPVLDVLGKCQAILMPPFAGTNIGMVRGLLLAPSALRLRRNPDDARLQDVLPAALYQRWLALKDRYLPRNKRVERYRPLFAAQTLYSEAIDSAGLDTRPVAEGALRKAADKLDLQAIQPRLTIELDSPRQLIRELSDENLDDLPCFEQTLSRLETDLDAMRQRANAWAIGDIEALRELPAPNHQGACADALANAQALADTGMADLRQRMREAWLGAAIDALATHEATFAYLPMYHLIGDAGLLQRLREAGYEIENPE